MPLINRTAALRRTVATLLLAGASSSAWAADAEGNFAVRGLGVHECEVYLEAVAAGGDRAAGFVAWIDGYLTAHNRQREATFDAVFLTDSNEVATLVASACRQARDARLENILARLLETLRPTRVREQSGTTEVWHNERRIVLHRETMRRAQRHLAERGLYDGEIDAAFGPDMSRALRGFQRNAGLPPTGVPDSDTLLRLFLSNQE